MSSPKNLIKGIVHQVGDIDFIGPKKDFPKQRIILFKPAFTDEYGEKKGKDDYFPLDILGNAVETLNINERYINQKVECEVYFSGSKFSKQDGTESFGLNANLVKLSIIQATNSKTQSSNAAASEDDDLPF